MTATTTINLTPNQTVNLLCVALKAAFPGKTFKVHSNSEFGRDSIDVSWVDGPTANAVDHVAQQFAEYVLRDPKYLAGLCVGRTLEVGQLVRLGVESVFCRRSMGSTIRDEIRAYVALETGREFDPTGTYTHAPVRQFTKEFPPLAVSSPNSVTGNHLVRQIFHLITC